MIWRISSWHTLSPVLPAEHHVHSSMTTLYPSSDYCFQQDKNPCDTAQMISHWYLHRNSEFTVFKCPPQSPVPNPIDELGWSFPSWMWLLPCNLPFSAAPFRGWIICIQDFMPNALTDTTLPTWLGLGQALGIHCHGVSWLGWCCNGNMDQNFLGSIPASSIVLNLCYEELRQLWWQKPVYPGTSNMYLIKWPVSVDLSVLPLLFLVHFFTLINFHRLHWAHISQYNKTLRSLEALVLFDFLEILFDFLEIKQKSSKMIIHEASKF